MMCALYGVGFQLLVQTSVPKIFSLLPGQFNTCLLYTSRCV